MNQRTELLDQLRIDRTGNTHPPVSRRWGWWLIVAIVVVAAVGAALLARTHESVPVRAVVATPGGTGSRPTIAGSLLDASGYVVALREATVSGKSIYKVNEVLVQEGQPVKQGQVMARLDDTNARAALEESKAQVKQLEAALAAARVAAADARPIFLRNQRQLAEGLISQESFDASKGSYDSVQAAVAVAEQNVAVVKATVEVNQRYEDDTVIRAPFDGIVTVKTAQPGEIVSPQFSGGGGIAKIVDMDSLEVDVDVSENYINRVYPKQRASITLNAYPDWQIPAEVIAVIPTADRAKATVKVRIGFKEKDARVVPEMGARVSFFANESLRQSALSPAVPNVVVPAEAIQATGEAGTVFVLNSDRVERRSVRLGARTPDGQVVLFGLEPGTRLAIGDFAKLRDGVRVQVVRQD